MKKYRKDDYGHTFEILKNETYRGYIISFEKETDSSLNRVFITDIKRTKNSLPNIDTYVEQGYTKEDTFNNMKDKIDFTLDGKKAYTTGLLKGSQRFWREIRKRDYKNIEGIKAEISIDEYDHYLNVLPPLYAKNGFYVPEPISGGLMTFISKKGNKYYMEVKDKWKDRTAELTEEEEYIIKEADKEFGGK